MFGQGRKPAHDGMLRQEPSEGVIAEEERRSDTAFRGHAWGCPCLSSQRCKGADLARFHLHLPCMTDGIGYLYGYLKASMFVVSQLQTIIATGKNKYNGFYSFPNQLLSSHLRCSPTLQE